MNYFALFAGVLVLLAAGVHAIIGGREVGLLKPEGTGKSAEVWVQTLAGWHWVSVGQTLAAVTFLVVGVTEWIPDEQLILGGLAIYFGSTGVVWLMTVLVAGRGVEGRWYRLGQWMYCLFIALLAFFAAG
ncbi:MAG: hypothetical protein AAF564_15780 [Bacteroidota bacterium]